MKGKLLKNWGSKGEEEDIRSLRVNGEKENKQREVGVGICIDEAFLGIGDGK